MFGYLAGICFGREALQTLVIGFIAFAMPHLVAWMIGVIGAIEDGLKRLFQK